MPELEAALKEYLKDPSNGVADLVTDTQGYVQIHPNRIPEDAHFPAIMFKRVSADRVNTYDPFGEMAAWVTARVQIDCWALKAEDAMTIGEAVLAALSGYDGSIGGDLIQSSFAVNELDTDETHGGTTFHRRILDFRISYEDAFSISS